MGHIMAYIDLKLLDIFVKLWDLFRKTMGYSGQNYAIYWARTTGLYYGLYLEKIWDILGKNYNIYFRIYWFKIFGHIWQTYVIY